MTQDGKHGVYISLVLVQVFFGINYLASKIALTELEPRALAAFRVAGAAVALTVIARLSGARWPTGRRLLTQLGLLSLIGIIANQILFIEGLARTTPTHSALIVTTIPVSTLVFAVLAGRERVTIQRLLAFGVALFGVVLVIQPWVDQGSSVSVLGDLLTLANAISFALFLAASKPVLARTDPLAATAVLMIFGSIGIGFIGIPQIMSIEFAAVSPRTWLLLGYIILFPTAAAYWLQYRALTRIDSSVVASFIYLQPVIATGLSVVFLGDRPDRWVLTGGTLIFMAVWLTLRGPAPVRQQVPTG